MIFTITPGVLLMQWVLTLEEWIVGNIKNTLV